MAITSELIGKLGGGGDVETVNVGSIPYNDLVIYSFTLDKRSVVSAALSGFKETAGQTGRWDVTAPSIEIRPTGGGVWGENRFGTSLLAHDSASGLPSNAQRGNARYLSISAALPPGNYEIVVNAEKSSRTLTVDTATIATVPL